MITSFIRKSILALATVASFGAVAPAFARDYGEPEIIYVDRDHRVGESSHRYQRQRHEIRRHVLSAQQIEYALRHQGYNHIQEMDFRGEIYRVIAVRHNGAVVKLRVSAFTGRVFAESRIGWARPARSYEDHWPRDRNRSGVTVEFGWGSDY